MDTLIEPNQDHRIFKITLVVCDRGYKRSNVRIYYAAHHAKSRRLAPFCARWNNNRGNLRGMVAKRRRRSIQNEGVLEKQKKGESREKISSDHLPSTWIFSAYVRHEIAKRTTKRSSFIARCFIGISLVRVNRGGSRDELKANERGGFFYGTKSCTV